MPLIPIPDTSKAANRPRSLRDRRQPGRTHPPVLAALRLRDDCPKPIFAGSPTPHHVHSPLFASPARLRVCGRPSQTSAVSRQNAFRTLATGGRTGFANRERTHSHKDLKTRRKGGHGGRCGMQPLSEEAVRQGRPPFGVAMDGAIRGRLWRVPSNPRYLSFESSCERVAPARPSRNGCLAPRRFPPSNPVLIRSSLRT